MSRFEDRPTEGAIRRARSVAEQLEAYCEHCGCEEEPHRNLQGCVKCPDCPGFSPTKTWPFASQPRRGKRVQHERAEQEALYQAVGRRPWHPRFFHWPQERQSRTEAWKLQRAGVKPGPSDNWLLLPASGFGFAVSELKRRDAVPSHVTEAQRFVLDWAMECGACVGVHKGWKESIKFFDDYVAGEGRHGERWWER